MQSVFKKKTIMNEMPITILYVSHTKMVEGIVKTSIHLTEKNEVLKEDFVTLVGTHNSFKHKHYLILDILKYQIPIATINECRLYMKNPEMLDSFVHKGWTYSNDIAWATTYDDLKPMNSLILLFKEKHKSSSQNVSKRLVQEQKKKKQTKRQKPLQLI